MTDKTENVTSTIYAENDLRGLGPGIATNNKVSYFKKADKAQCSIYGMTIEEGSVEEHLLDGFLKDYLENATLTAEEAEATPCPSPCRHPKPLLSTTSTSRKAPTKFPPMWSTPRIGRDG